MQVSESGLTMLRRLNDYSIGGQEVTPAVESYDNLKMPRVGLGTLSSWTSYEAVHINPAAKSLRAAYKSLRIEASPPKSFWDRVVLMDFDIYDKFGVLKAATSITPEEVLARLKEFGITMPYCCIRSGTQGNFHMMWVYKTPQPRTYANRFLKQVYTSWGADPRFTNSTMRNPIFLEARDSSAVHWWYEWVSEEPLLEDVRDLIPLGAPTAPPPERSSRGSGFLVPSSRGRFRSRLSQHQLEIAMSRAEDGDGRWHLLKSWLVRRIMAECNGFPICNETIRSWVEEGNQLLKVPMVPRRLEELISYWTPARQEWYVARQVKAGESNAMAVITHKQAVLKYFQVYDLRQELLHYLKIGMDNLPEDLRERDRQYRGRKLAPNRVPCYAYLAWMLGWEDKNDIDLTTGEVITTVTAEAQVKSTLSNGARLGYSREEYLDILESVDLTNEEGLVTIESSTAGDTCDKISPRKGLLYAGQL